MKFKELITVKKFTLSALVLAAGLQACAGQGERDQVESAQSLTPTAAPLALVPGQAALQRWSFSQAEVALVKDGLRWQATGQAPETAQLLAGEYDSLDARGDLLAALVEGGHGLQLFQVTERGLVPRVKASFTDLLADEQCLYLSRQSGQLYSFVQDGRGASQQWLLAEQGKPLAAARRVRDIPMPYGTELCAADDAQGVVYLSEQGQGLWQLAAEPEAMPARKAVLLNKPFGAADGEITGLLSVEGDILAISGQTLWRITQGDSQPSQAWSLALASPEKISAHWLDKGQYKGQDKGQDKGMAIAIYDDETGQQFTGQLPVARAPEWAAERIAQVAPVRETPAAAQTGDAMDDPAIWVNPNNPDASRVLGTHKKLGLYVYDLQGRELQFLPDGRLNNVDVRPYGLAAGLGADLAVASKREDNSVLLYGINAKARVSKLAAFATDLSEIYGICMGIWQGQHQVFVNDKDGRVQQYRLTRAQGQWQMLPVRELKLASQPEGCAFDDAQGRLFVGEEGHGIWTLSLQDESPAFAPVAQVGELLKRDVEGMAIASYTDQPSLLVVSSQGNDSYLVYEAAPPYQYRGRFRIGLSARNGVDGSSETDGLDVTSHALGADFPGGLLVVQDGRNLMPSQGQNFKFISWQSVLDTLQPPEQITTR